MNRDEFYSALETNRAYLAHHGVLGMKWGVRRYQNEDGTWKKGVTSTDREARKAKVREAKDQYKQAKKQYKSSYRKANRYSNLHPISQVVTEKGQKESQARWEKADKDLMAKLEAKANYKAVKKYGNNDKESIAKAKDQMSKVLKIAAGATMAGLAGYAAYKYGKLNFDQVIKKGTKFQRVSTSAIDDISRPFYATHSKTDKIKYAGMYGNNLKYGNAMQRKFGLRTNNPVYNHTLVAERNLKVAGSRNAKKAFNDLYKNNPEFKRNADRAIKDFEQYDFKPGMRMNKYNKFNRALVNHKTENDNVVQKQFYDELKRRGYSGVKDVNDRKYSGYNAKGANIYFGNEKHGNVSITKSREMSTSEIGKKNAAGLLMNLGEQNIYAVGAGSALGMYATGASLETNSKKKKNKGK